MLKEAKSHRNIKFCKFEMSEAKSGNPNGNINHEKTNQSLLLRKLAKT